MCSGRARDVVAIHVESDGKVELRGCPQAAIKGHSLKRIDRKEIARDLDFDRVAKAPQSAGQHLDAHECAATARDIQWRGSKETDSHFEKCSRYRGLNTRWRSDLQAAGNLET